MKLYICKIDYNFSSVKFISLSNLIINWSNDQLTHYKKIKLSAENFKISKSM
jgi:hypothetical protein